VQREQAGAGDEETHLVFLVEVLVEEFRAHRVLLRVVRRDAHHVHGLEPALGDETVDVAAIGVEDDVRASPGAIGRAGRPLLEPDIDPAVRAPSRPGRWWSAAVAGIVFGENSQRLMVRVPWRVSSL
jgi:hypothetical protein